MWIIKGTAIKWNVAFQVVFQPYQPKSEVKNIDMTYDIQKHIGHVPFYEVAPVNPTLCTNTVCINQRLWKVSN